MAQALSCLYGSPGGRSNGVQDLNGCAANLDCRISIGTSRRVFGPGSGFGWFFFDPYSWMVRWSAVAHRSSCSSDRSKRCTLARRISAVVRHSPACARRQKPGVPKTPSIRGSLLTSMRLARCAARRVGVHDTGECCFAGCRALPARACHQPCRWNDMSEMRRNPAEGQRASRKRPLRNATRKLTLALQAPNASLSTVQRCGQDQGLR